MANTVLMPQLGISEETAVLSQFFVAKGDRVRAGQRLFSLETGKSTFEFESEYDGTVLALLCAEGDELPIKAPVMVIGEEGEAVPEIAPSAPAAAPVESAPAPAAGPAPAAAVPAASPAAAPDAPRVSGISPRARMLAEKAGITDFSGIVPTGPEGRVIERDVAAALDRGYASAAAAAPEQPAAASPAAPEYTDEPVSRMRKLIARRMHESLSQSAQLTLNASFDATELLRFRRSAKAGVVPGFEKVTVNDLVLFAVSRTLPDFPDLNAHFLGDTMRRFSNVNLGFACDTERGLTVPVIRGAETLSLRRLSARAKELARACQEGTASAADLSGASFTVSNLGSLGVTSFTPVLDPPQVAILGVCAAEAKARLGEDGQPVWYEAMGLSLTFDHRALDGAPAARFLQALCRRLEALPLLLAM